MPPPGAQNLPMVRKLGDKIFQGLLEEGADYEPPQKRQRKSLIVRISLDQPVKIPINKSFAPATRVFHRHTNQTRLADGDSGDPLDYVRMKRHRQYELKPNQMAGWELLTIDAHLD